MGDQLAVVKSVMNGVFYVLDVRVDAVQIPDVLPQMERWIEDGSEGHYIAVTGMHGIMESRRDAYFKEVLAAADLVVPDGMPLVWLGRANNFPLQHRVSGPELMEAFLQKTGDHYRHFLYGGAEGVADDLARNMKTRFGSDVVGTYTPPFRPLVREEDDEVVETIRALKPDVVWVGLSTPKQERWIFEHRHRLGVPLMLGVGAAFDFHTGRVKRAPQWMRTRGLEWSYRLMKNPRRLWHRYLVYGSQFAFHASVEVLKNKLRAASRVNASELDS
ncbi:MAG TPA: WecB/TagA/CpsF family glycosyltransferase [Terriglobia bacterium]|nr:WecB/TagA/CpsF family glycosyltransferase [Terriglobia bacterium]